MAPLLSELQNLCQSYEEGDCDRGAAASMLELLRHEWTDVPAVTLPPVEDHSRSADELALIIVRDVGEVADVLLSEQEPDERLGWCRANLIRDLERYSAATNLA